MAQGYPGGPRLPWRPKKVKIPKYIPYRKRLSEKNLITCPKLGHFFPTKVFSDKVYTLSDNAQLWSLEIYNNLVQIPE